jgi:hypothetical protein
MSVADENGPGGCCPSGGARVRGACARRCQPAHHGAMSGPWMSTEQPHLGRHVFDLTLGRSHWSARSAEHPAGPAGSSATHRLRGFVPVT